MAIRYSIPSPLGGELPSAYADRVGLWHTHSASAVHRRSCGQYFTPVSVARFIAGFFRLAPSSGLRILDPGAGTGVLSCAFCERLAQSSGTCSEVSLVAYEVDPELAALLQVCLRYGAEWLEDRGITLRSEVRQEDFLLAQGALLQTKQLCMLREKSSLDFDFAIGNPPYFKLRKTDPRAQIAKSVVYGQPNIYALFMAVAASLLRDGGQMAFITPRSYATGEYFRVFRQAFFEMMKPFALHVFRSRADAFHRDSVLQENIILAASREDGWWDAGGNDTVDISASAGLADLDHPRRRALPLHEIFGGSSVGKALRIPISEDDSATALLVDRWQGTLRSLGLEISTGPVIPFRAPSVLSGVSLTSGDQAPLLWMQSVLPMRVQWPIRIHKPQYMKINEASKALLLPDRNYVLLRRFSSKEQDRRLTAAPLLAGTFPSRYIGIENHVNYIHRPGGSLGADEAYGLAALLNSSLLDSYFRLSNGHTQVNATELRAMPLPDLAVIREIGKMAMSAGVGFTGVDPLVQSILLQHKVCSMEGIP